MSTPFQNRLVGTIIVAATIIIFLPDILDGKKNTNQADFDVIPNAPTFTGKTTQKPFPDDQLVKKEDVPILNEKAQDEQLLTNNEQNETAEPDSSITKVTPAEKVKDIATSTNARSKTKNDAAIEKSVLGQQPVQAVNKEAWVIQLGTFKNKNNVTELVNKLKSNGYTVFTKPIQTKQGTLTKVFIGPELIQASLAKKVPVLKKLTNVQGKVSRFYPD